MQIAPNKVVSVHYTLTEGTADGQLVESTNGQDPLAFIYGVGMMIPEFEKNLAGMKTGDRFSFGIVAANAYGEYDDAALVEVPKNAFEHEGKIPDGLLEVGNVLPLTDQEGNHFQGMVAHVGADTVKIDFNHPMAGVDLYFTGHVEGVRDADPSELAHGHVHGPGGHHH
ncbi:MAG TPA: FKBP-type peptidyl-prolyl cis-trans isomerase [Saprospiraceae bacterium]|nr:FKBP-type peptidyl-prolyl cis-trans isomerase [Saprospiraceae bacterium]HND90051.1 FKBP-type peptidyl-prolyl cis-trans isomerase [Saprospiraceae bacterium]HNG91118.1 FKBP-type peptidyl-prolyl cis-trans isomerase [Saprospiraceae bacterium]